MFVMISKSFRLAIYASNYNHRLIFIYCRGVELVNTWRRLIIACFFIRLLCCSANESGLINWWTTCCIKWWRSASVQTILFEFFYFLAAAWSNVWLLGRGTGPGPFVRPFEQNENRFYNRAVNETLWRTALLVYNKIDFTHFLVLRGRYSG